MVVAVLILIFSTAMFFFYFQATCQRVLRREFDREYFMPLVNANRLEFPSVRKAVMDYSTPLEYSRFRMMLKCDFLALTYLLKSAGNQQQRYSKEDRLLMLYFRLTVISLTVRHFLHWGERQAILRLTSILAYLGNVVGRRVNLAKIGELSAADYLLTLD